MLMHTDFCYYHVETGTSALEGGNPGLSTTQFTQLMTSGTCCYSPAHSMGRCSMGILGRFLGGVTLSLCSLLQARETAVSAGVSPQLAAASHCFIQPVCFGHPLFNGILIRIAFLSFVYMHSLVRWIKRPQYFACISSFIFALKETHIQW